MTPGYTYRATIERVIDGDTIVALVDLGFATFSRQTFRLVGVNCPEMNTQAGKDAREFTDLWFLSNKRCVIQTVKDKREKYGRYLARVFDDQGKCLNAELIANNLAVAYME